MNTAVINLPYSPAVPNARAEELFQEAKQRVTLQTDSLFVRLLIWQWLVTVIAAVLISPLTWAGVRSQINPHVLSAIFLGGLLTAFPVLLAVRRPGKWFTRHTVAVGQMLMSALLIHLTGGRIETHFHVFGSLAILAFYRDWRVLISASAVVYMDHILRGMFWPQSVYGVLSASSLRSVEHAAWVIFEVTFLIISIRTSLAEMSKAAERQASLEAMKDGIERAVAERTEELSKEVVERRQAEEKLLRSQAQLAEAQQIAQLGSWEWDVVKNKVTWSEETRRLYGFKPEDSGADMNHSLEHVHPDDRGRVQEALTASVLNGTDFVMDHRAVLPDGTERIMHGMAKVIRDPAGKPLKMIGTTQDITGSKRAEEALRRSEEQLLHAQKMEAVGRLAGGVAHDFNNLLTVINGYCSISIQQLDSEDPLLKNLEEIEKAAERAGALTGQLLAFSRKQVLKPRIINLDAVVTGMDKMLRRVIGEDIQLNTTFDAGLWNVKADPGQIEQVILNMAVNARDAMPRGGKLSISAKNISFEGKTRFRDRDLEPGDYVVLSINDTGAGMTAEVQAHIFEPFFTTKGVGRGTGLGLATCHGIICQSGGDIRVRSEVQAGASFEIYLPRVNGAIEIDQETLQSEALPRGTESILVVEDEGAVRRLATTVLRDRGYIVREARNGAEALSLIRAGSPFDLVLTDVIMPRMSGRELYNQIKVIKPEVKVLFMSGYTDDALAIHGVLDPSLSFLEKPFTPSRLAHKVRETIDDHRLANAG
jgi:PAS domain S-box-containing protein